MSDYEQRLRNALLHSIYYYEAAEVLIVFEGWRETVRDPAVAASLTVATFVKHGNK